MGSNAKSWCHYRPASLNLESIPRCVSEFRKVGASSSTCRTGGLQIQCAYVLSFVARFGRAHWFYCNNVATWHQLRVSLRSLALLPCMYTLWPFTWTFDTTNSQSERLFRLPMFFVLSEGQQERVVEAVIKFSEWTPVERVFIRTQWPSPPQCPKYFICMVQIGLVVIYRFRFHIWIAPQDNFYQSTLTFAGFV